MNNLDMEEHQAGLEKEQIKQAKVGEVLSNKPEIKEPKKQMKNVGVDATKVLKDRFTQAGFKTADVGVSATQQTRSTASGSTEPRVIHNSAQTMDESDVLQDQMDKSIALLNQAQQDNQQKAKGQQKASSNLASALATETLKLGKGIGQAVVTTALIGQGIAPQFAALGGSAAAGAMEAGYNFAFGGASSSSSGMQPMDQSMGQQKRNPEEEVEPRGRRGRPKTKRGDELVIAEGGNGNGNGNGGKAKAKAKTKAEKRQEKESEQLTQPETDKPASKPKNIPVQKPYLKQKGDQVSPSQIGIQKLREEFLNSRNEGNLSDEDYSEYLKLYDDFVAAKGKPSIKKEKLKGLKASYKKSIYRK